MKLHMPGKYFMAGLLLVATAAVLIVIALVTNRGDMTTAAVVIAGMICVVTGIFILTFSGGEPIDPRLVGLLSVQDQISICKIASDLGITGNAHFLPPVVTGEERLMIFNPLSTWQGNPARSDDSFSLSGSAGLITVPSCDPLLRDIKKRTTLPAAASEEEITRLLKETISGTFELASGVTITWQNDTVTVTLHDYRFIDGCQIVAEESPRCCIMHPCATCSLCGALIAQGKATVVSLDQCSPDLSKQEITAVFSVLSAPDRHPQV
jgi:hypothetical protein